jgi:4-amino-4-deoxy-L-arabinose transferase-like glycosyltransferase
MKVTARTLSWLHTLPGVLALVAFYSLVHVGARLGASGNLGEDDPLENLWLQSLAWGYDPGQPPLYDWLLWGLQRVFGTGLHAFLVLKYSLLVALAGLLFLIARRLTGSGFWGLLAVDAMALTYQIFWRFHEGFTHRVGAMTLALATVWVLLCLIDHRRRRDYLGFGLVVGLGLLTETRYLWLLGALLIAAWLQPAARSALRAPGMAVSALVAGVVVAPWAAWLLSVPERAQAFSTALWPGPAQYSVSAGLAAVGEAAIFPFLVLSPYIFILPAIFPGVLRTLVGHTSPQPKEYALTDFRQMLGHALLILFCLGILLDGLLWQRQDYAVHSLLPVFVVALAWLTAVVRESAPSPGRIRAFVVLSLVVTVVALLGRVANMYVLDPVCNKCRWGTPYAELASAMRTAGFAGGVLLTPEVELGGNLRRFFPDARIVVPSVRTSANADATSGRPMVVVWNARLDTARVVAGLRTYLPESPASLPEPALIRVPWSHLWKPVGYRYSEWRLWLIDGAGNVMPIQ